MTALLSSTTNVSSVLCEKFYGREKDNTNQEQMLAIACMYSLTTCICLFTDTLLIYLILSKSDMRKIRLNLYLLNMSLMDIGLSSSLLILSWLNLAGSKIFGVTWDDKVKYTSGAAAYFWACSVYTVAALTLETYKIVTRDARSTLTNRLHAHVSMFCRKKSVLVICAIDTCGLLYAILIGSNRNILILSPNLLEAKIKVPLQLIIRDIIPLCIIITVLSLSWMWLQRQAMPSYMARVMIARKRSLHIVTAIVLLNCINCAPMAVCQGYYSYVLIQSTMDESNCARYPELVSQMLSLPAITWTFKLATWLGALNSNLTLYLLMWTSRHFRRRAVQLKDRCLHRMIKTISTKKQLVSVIFSPVSVTEMSVQAVGALNLL